ncbi:MAG: ribose-phosphate diphosphokinase [Bacilli bacterium]
MKKINIFGLTNSNGLADDIANHLGLKLSACSIQKFADGEMIAQGFNSVRGSHCYVVQPTSPPNVNESIMELLIMIDALKRADAKSICAVIPYYGYARQDRKCKPRQPITSKLVATILEAAGATRVMVMDLHASQIQGFFNVQIDEFSALPIITKHFKEKNIEDMTIVSPDHGGAVRAKKMSELLKCPTAIIDKQRPRPNESEVVGIIGKVKNRNCILIDDMIDTGGSIVNAVIELKKEGAKDVYVACTHPLFSDPAIERLSSCDAKEIVVTNTIHIDKEKRFDNLIILNTAELFADGINAVYEERSLGDVIQEFENKVLEK